MQKLTETIVESAAYASGQTRTIDIDLAGYVTEIVFRFHLNVAQTSVASLVQDGILRMIRGLRFTASNVKDWYTIRDGREGYYLAYLKNQGHVYTSLANLPAGMVVARDVECQFVFHPGVMPGNPFDITRCIPLRGKSNVQVEVDWGVPATHLGTGYSVSTDDSEGLSVEVSRVVLEKGESEAEAFKPLDHIFVPRLLPVTHAVDAIYAAFAFSRDILTGAYMRDVMLLVLDSSGDRSAAEVSQFRVVNNKGGIFHVRRSWAGFEREITGRYYLAALVTGLGIIDFRNITGKDYGLDMVQASKGDWMLEFSTAVADGEIRTLFEGADLESVDPTEIGT